MAADSGKNIDLCLDGGIARLTLTRADKLNPLDWDTVRELKAAVAEIDARADIFAVVVTGRGRSFSAGGDLEGYLTLYRHPDRLAAFLDDFYTMLTAIEASSKIYIAAVNGVCVAGGIELLLACDLAIAADAARIGDGHLNFGQLPGAGSSQRLPRAVGLLRAKHLMLTGELLSAEDARRIGLVNSVVPAAELDSDASGWRYAAPVMMWATAREEPRGSPRREASGQRDADDGPRRRAEARDRIRSPLCDDRA